MFSINVQCKSCGDVPPEGKVFLSYERYVASLGELKCQKCGGYFERIYITVPGMIIKEGHSGESSKPSSYWRNAEANRQKDLRKRSEDKKEKDFYIKGNK